MSNITELLSFEPIVYIIAALIGGAISLATSYYFTHRFVPGKYVRIKNDFLILGQMECPLDNEATYRICAVNNRAARGKKGTGLYCRTIVLEYSVNSSPETIELPAGMFVRHNH